MTFTKIGVTIGPACSEIKILKEMINSGMTFARLNFSHGDYEDHGRLIDNIRKAELDLDSPVAIMQDLQGPKIRIGQVPEKGIDITEKKEVILNISSIDKEISDQNIPVVYDGLHEHLKNGETILIDDGRIELKIIKIEDTKIKCEVIEGGVIISHKGMNFPDSDLSVSSMTEKDKEDVRFGVQKGVDIVALSFVKTSKDILDLKFLIKKYEQELGIERSIPVQVFAKIERNQAVKNIKEIIEVADGIMVARGDLGLEMPAYQTSTLSEREN